ncbi:MAG TPA: DUF1570 domain-containing protein, partial [Pyrinomonadaceae bacterium]|nr:DUF1570 domain-containing protein [Pyrinomonadaceae bacterium]
MIFKAPKHCACLAAMALGLLLAVGVYGARDHEEVWTSVQSKNFLLVGNAAERDIAKVAARLEQFRETFMRLLPGMQSDSFVPVTVLVFRDEESYRPFEPLYQGRPSDVVGFFQSSHDVDYITLTVDRKNVRDPFSLAFHEYVHLLVRNSFTNAPLWFNEGLAEYYSTFEIADGNRRVTLGKPVSAHAQLLHTGELIPLQKLLSVNRDSEFYNEKSKRSLFYAESWALLHYLMSGERRAQLSTYLNLTASGMDIEAAFRKAFQTGFDEIESELRQYI